MYFIIEIQGYAGGAFGHLVTTASTRNAADAEYHRILAAAAVSGLPLHSATILDGTGAELRHECYTHESDILNNEPGNDDTGESPAE